MDCLRELSIDCTIEHGIIHAKARKIPLQCTNIFMRFPSVLATGNIIMVATLADGITTIQNAAREPEIVDLAIMLNSMGARISSTGTNSITIHGVKSLHGIEHELISNRIETGTLLTAIVITDGTEVLENCIPEHNTALISHLLKCGV